MSSSNKIHFLLTGATGYIGGAVLTRFLSHPNAGNFHFTLLVRDPKKAERFNQMRGVSAVVGSHDDAPLVERLASGVDVVIAAADSDNLVAVETILAGLKKRYAATGVKPVFIHTSGAAVVMDQAKGTHASDTIWDDADVEQMESLPATQLHRNVDLAVVNADAEGYVRTYVLIPTLVYGLATGPLVDAGLQKRHSQIIPLLIKVARERGCAGVVGEGKNVWPNVSIQELPDLYVALYDSISSNPTGTGHGREGYYFAESGESSIYEISHAIGSALLALGLTSASSAEPSAFSDAELARWFGGSTFLGANARCRTTRGLEIGWRPVMGTGDLLGSVRGEVEALIGEGEGEGVQGGGGVVGKLARA